MQDSNQFTYAGTRWLEGSNLLAPAQLFGRFPARSGLSHLMPTLSGVDAWFCDFNEAHQFSIGLGGAYPGVSGNTLSAQPIPGPTDPALLAKLDLDGGVTDVNYASTIVTDFTAPNVQHLSYWGRNNIGSPTTISFWTDRNLGTDNELHSSVKLGCANANQGFMAYQPLHAIGLSTGTRVKEFGFAARVRKQSGSIPVGAGFFGYSEAILFGTVPLDTAGALVSAANAYYIGFFIDTSDKIWIVYNLANGARILYDTGLTVNTFFTWLEIRAVQQNDTGFNPVGGFYDFFVDGVKVLRSGTDALKENRTIRWNDIALWNSSTPLSPAMAVVKTSGASGNPLYQVDAIGSWHSRLLHINR